MSQLFDWVAGTFEKKYRRVGVLEGTFFTSDGKPTPARHELLRKQKQAARDKELSAELKVRSHLTHGHTQPALTIELCATKHGKAGIWPLWNHGRNRNF